MQPQIELLSYGLGFFVVGYVSRMFLQFIARLTSGDPHVEV